MTTIGISETLELRLDALIITIIVTMSTLRRRQTLARLLLLLLSLSLLCSAATKHKTQTKM
uniref:Uncharacterized protein n=1 Tax=Brassica oleracea TaxID=3712 RepID=A0A3P6E0N5_BRAOL|nr:unnamed protein product [Brassica oleracea]